MSRLSCVSQRGIPDTRSVLRQTKNGAAKHKFDLEAHNARKAEKDKVPAPALRAEFQVEADAHCWSCTLQKAPPAPKIMCECGCGKMVDRYVPLVAAGAGWLSKGAIRRVNICSYALGSDCPIIPCAGRYIRPARRGTRGVTPRRRLYRRLSRSAPPHKRNSVGVCPC